MKIHGINNICTEKSRIIQREIDSNMPRKIRLLTRYRKTMGEKQDIIINAIGTGIVAPIFIRYNPLSKSDKQTKAYSALRQTAMLIIAITIQTGLLIPLDKFIEKSVKSGSLGEKFAPQNTANVKALKRILPIGMAFFTIPFSCWILNKTYPKFMDKFFPKISGKVEVKSEN